MGDKEIPNRVFKKAKDYKMMKGISASALLEINRYCLIISIIILFTSWTVYYNLGTPWFYQILLFVLVISRTIGKINNQQRNLFILFTLLSTWYYMPSNFSPHRMMTGVLCSISISSLFLLNKVDLEKIVTYLFNLIAIISVIGLALYLCENFGIMHLRQISVVAKEDGITYDVYPFFVTIRGILGRFQGIFNEPGYLGTLVGLYLALDKFDLKKPINIILSICGFFTFSLAFYLIVGISGIAYLLRERKVWPLIFVGLAYFALLKFFPDFMESFFARREFVSYVETGSLNDTRGGVEQMYESLSIIGREPLTNQLFGNGYDSYLALFGDNSTSIATSSIFRLIYQVGYMGVALLILFIIKNTPKQYYSYLFSIVFIVSLYQRPQIYQSIFVILLACNLYGKRFEIDKG